MDDLLLGNSVFPLSVINHSFPRGPELLSNYLTDFFCEKTFFTGETIVS